MVSVLLAPEKSEAAAAPVAALTQCLGATGYDVEWWVHGYENMDVGGEATPPHGP